MSDVLTTPPSHPHRDVHEALQTEVREAPPAADEPAIETALEHLESDRPIEKATPRRRYDIGLALVGLGRVDEGVEVITEALTAAAAERKKRKARRASAKKAAGKGGAAAKKKAPKKKAAPKQKAAKKRTPKKAAAKKTTKKKTTKKKTAKKKAGRKATKAGGRRKRSKA